MFVPSWFTKIKIWNIINKDVWETKCPWYEVTENIRQPWRFIGWASWGGEGRFSKFNLRDWKLEITMNRNRYCWLEIQFETSKGLILDVEREGLSAYIDRNIQHLFIPQIRGCVLMIFEFSPPGSHIWNTVALNTCWMNECLGEWMAGWLDEYWCNYQLYKCDNETTQCVSKR